MSRELEPEADLRIAEEPLILGDEPDAQGFDPELGDFARDGEALEEEEAALELEPLREPAERSWIDDDAPLAHALGEDELHSFDVGLGDEPAIEGLDAHDELHSFRTGEDDGGAEGAQGIEGELDEIEGELVSDDGEEGLRASLAVVLPPWAETMAARFEDASSFEWTSPVLPPGALAIARDANGERLVVLEHEDGAVFLRGERVVSERVPELPLAGIALHRGRPVYWVEGQGLLLDQSEVPFTEATTALAAAEGGLLLGLDTAEGAALAFWSEATDSVECIAVLPSAPLALAAQGLRAWVKVEQGTLQFLLPR